MTNLPNNIEERNGRLEFIDATYPVFLEKELMWPNVHHDDYGEEPEYD